MFESLCHDCWLVDSATDIYVCNDLFFMINYWERSTNISRFISNRIFSKNGSMCLWLALKDDSEKLILNLHNAYYLSRSSCNFMSLVLLNINEIFYDNEYKILYQIRTKQIFEKAKRWKNNYLLRLLNLSTAAVQLFKADDNTYKWPSWAFCTTSPNSLLFTIWHMILDHINFCLLNSFLQRLYKDIFTIAINKLKQLRCTIESSKESRNGIPIYTYQSCWSHQPRRILGWAIFFYFY